jgi:hypothetical protein
MTGGAKTQEDLRRKLDVLRRYCEELERPYDTVLRSHLTLPLVMAETNAAVQAKVDQMGERSMAGLFAGTPERTLAYYRGLVAAGLRYFLVTVRVHDFETLRMLGEQALPAFAAG